MTRFPPGGSLSNSLVGDGGGNCRCWWWCIRGVTCGRTASLLEVRPRLLQETKLLASLCKHVLSGLSTATETTEAEGTLRGFRNAGPLADLLSAVFYGMDQRVFCDVFRCVPLQSWAPSSVAQKPEASDYPPFCHSASDCSQPMPVFLAFGLRYCPPAQFDTG